MSNQTTLPTVNAALKFLTGADASELAAIGIEIIQSEAAAPTAEPAATFGGAQVDALATLTAQHQALVARCAELMHAFVAAKNAAETAYNQNTLLSAQANEAWQLHREQSHLARQLHDLWHDALRERQDLFAEIHKLEKTL